MYQRMGKAAYKADLSNTIKLVEHLDNPHNSFKTIHVAGTNGKGSTSHMLASILQEAGYKVGLYTSPHLKDFRERIKINGEMIPKRTVSTFVKKHKPFFEANELSFFEMTVGLAFDYFRKANVDIALIEVGLGGRLDSTNVITPVISVITNIGLDHTRFLGTTISEIAKEKAGIIKEKVPVVIGETTSETKTIFLEIAKDRNTSITFTEDEKTSPYPTDLQGSYQKFNIRTAQIAIKALQKKGWAIGIQHIAKGLQKVVENTGLLGRWQILQENPKVICDTAHNTEGLVFVMRQLRKEKFDKLHIVLGVVDDKDLNVILPLFPRAATYYFCKPEVPRGLDAEILKDNAEGFKLSGDVYNSVREAYKAAVRTSGIKDVIYIGGSTFVVAEVL